MQKLKKTIFLCLLILSYGLLTYYYFGGWWNSSLGTLLILFFSYLVWKRDFLKQTGLQLNFSSILKSLLLAVLTAVFAWLMMKHIAGKHHVLIQTGHWQNYYHNVFYILNEEIVIGAILLFAMVGEWRLRPLVAALGLAVFFALIHFVFYKWIFDDRGNLGVIALATLFLVGFVRNSLILQTGHIGYSWALHFGWMAVIFGNRHIDSATNTRLAEYDRFNLYLGSPEMLIVSIVLAGVILVYWKKKGLLHPAKIQ